MRWFARFRLLLARRPWIYWVCTISLAAAIGFVVTSSVAQVSRRKAQWGETVRVYVAAAAIGPGEALDAHTQDMPIAVVPVAAVRQLPDGAIARHPVGIGEIVVESDVTVRDGPGALVPEGWLALAIESNSTGLFALGDHAAVFAGGQPVARDAIVVSLHDGQVTVAVPRSDAGRVSNAATQHLAVLALDAGPPRE